MIVLYNHFFVKRASVTFLKTNVRNPVFLNFAKKRNNLDIKILAFCRRGLNYEQQKLYHTKIIFRYITGIQY